MSLIGTGPLLFFLGLLTLAVFTALFALRRAPRARTWALIAAFGLSTLTWLLYNRIYKPFNSQLDWYLFLAIAGLVLAVGAVIGARRQRRLAAASLLLALFSGVGLVNVSFAQYPNVRSLLPVDFSVAMSYEEFATTTSAPQISGRAAGALVSVDFAPTNSGFEARSALAYIPPAYWQKATLPVIVLIAGNPGSPGQWFGAGQADITLDDYQLAHNGVSPIVISVDGTGSTTANPMCVDSEHGNVMTWMSQDVPAGIKSKFRVDENQQHWTIGGLSYGGTCALQVVTNHPETFGTFLNYSGEAEPTIGSHQESVDKFFGGDEEAYQAVNPAHLLKEAAGTEKYTHIAGKFISGNRDEPSQKALRALNELAQAAGMKTDYAETPGAHTSEVWRAAFRNTLDFAAQRGGLID